MHSPVRALATCVVRYPLAIVTGWLFLSLIVGAISIAFIGDLVPDFFAGTHPYSTLIAKEAQAIAILQAEATPAFARARVRWRSAAHQPSMPAPHIPAAPIIPPEAWPAPPPSAHRRPTSIPPSAPPLLPHMGWALSAQSVARMCASVMGFTGCSPFDRITGAASIAPTGEGDDAQSRHFEMVAVAPATRSLHLGLGLAGGVEIWMHAGSTIRLGRSTGATQPSAIGVVPFGRGFAMLGSLPVAFEGNVTVRGFGLAAGSVPLATQRVASSSTAAVDGSVRVSAHSTSFTLHSSPRFSSQSHGASYAVTFDLFASASAAAPPTPPAPPAAPPPPITHPVAPPSPPGPPPCPPSPLPAPPPSPPPAAPPAAPPSRPPEPPSQPPGTIMQPAQRVRSGAAFFTFRARRPNESVFTSRGLLEMLALYRAIEAQPRREDYCLLVPSPSSAQTLECEPPRTPLQLFFAPAHSRLFSRIDLAALRLPAFSNLSSAISRLGTLPLLFANAGGGVESLLHGCDASCAHAGASAHAGAPLLALGRTHSPDGAGLQCSTSLAIGRLNEAQRVQLVQQLRREIGAHDETTSAPEAEATTAETRASGGAVPSSSSARSHTALFGASGRLRSLGACEPLLELRALVRTHGEAAVSRVAGLHYQLFKLMSEEWMRPLPPPTTELRSHDPQKVLRLVASLLGEPSLSRFAALPALFFEAGFRAGHPISAVTRAFFSFGGPRFGAPNVWSSGQDADFARWWGSGAVDAFYSGDAHWHTLSPAYVVGSDTWFEGRLLAIMRWDVLRALLPIGIVGAVALVQTRDGMLALASVATILLALALALASFARFLGGTWLSIYAYPALYITIGVGADDVFICTQAWTLSEGEPDATVRLEHTYRTAGHAMLTTTLTSVAAFVATMALTSVPSGRAFGWLAAAALLMAYVLVCTFYSACLVLVHRRGRAHSRRSALCCRPRSANRPLAHLDAANDRGPCPATASTFARAATEAAAPTATPAANRRRLSRRVPASLSARLAALHLAPIRFRRATIAIFLLGVAPCTLWQLSQLQVSTLPPTFLPWDHPLQRAYLDNAHFGASALEPVDSIALAWGLAPAALDVSAVDLIRNRSFVGAPIRDPAFALTEAAQRHLLDTCDLLRHTSLVRATPDFVAGGERAMVHCWPDAWKAHRESRGLPFPITVPGAAVAALFAWLASDEAAAAAWGEDVGFDWPAGDEGAPSISYVLLRADTHIKAFYPPPRAYLEQQHAAWQALVERVNAGAPPSAAHAVQVLNVPSASLTNKWIQMTMHDSYIRMAACGVGTGLAVASTVLLLSTCSPTISLIATGCLVLVMAAVVALMAAAGWRLGMTEAMCLIVVGGLCIDYVLHIAHAYAQAEPTLDRVARAELAVSQMSSPILAGMATTLAAAVSLSLCSFSVLSRMGLFMSFAICSSYVCAQTLLPALLSSFGPCGRCRTGTVERYESRAVHPDAAEENARTGSRTGGAKPTWTTWSVQMEMPEMESTQV